MKEIKNLSKIRLFVGIVITAVAMFIFMPINVFATTDYEIYVNGEQFTSEKTTINCGDGTATFDISTNTLILNNATITKRYGYQYAVINSEISNLTIQLIGNNVIDGNEGAYDGIDAGGGSNVVIVGDGNLTMKDVYYGTYIGNYSVPGGNLKINNTTINIENAQATGIWVNHDLEIINSNIKIDKTGDDVYFGIVSNIGGTITIDGGNLDINTNSHCILLGNGDDSNHNVVIKSGNIKLNSRRNGTYGIKFEPVQNTDTINGNIKIDGGNLEISASAGGTNIDDSKITINSKVKFLEGTSLKNNGKIVLNETKNYYTVTFDSNGGSAVTAQSIEAGQKATKPADPTKDGYDFKGWTLNGSAYDFNTAVNGNITLVATWEQQQVVPTTYTVSFDANGGTGSMADATGVSGDYVLPVCGFTAPNGKQFKAWSVGGVEKAVGDKITVTADTTVKAVWENITYTVSFDANGGGGTMTAQTGVLGEYPLPSNGFTAPTGKRFKCWSVGGDEKAVGDKITVNANTIVTAVWENIPVVTYTVTFYANGGSVTPASAETTAEGKLTSLPTPTRSRYSFVGWYTAASGGAKITTDTVFSKNTTVYAQWTYSGGGGGYVPATYSVTADKTENGSISVSPKSASTGSTVTITVTPDAGYELEKLTVTDSKGNEVELTPAGQNQYTFTMPGSKVEIKASFKPAETITFTDAAEGAYYYDAVLWAAEQGITDGTGNGKFSPDAPCTRAQIVTFLWRAAGSPEPKSMNSFSDVSADAYYAKAVAWAVEQGITGGTGNGKFSPDAPCTRAQIVAFLWRAAGSPAVSGDAVFSDVSADAYYADAVAWAEQNGVTNGIGGGLFGSGNDCTRAQIVTFLYRAYQGE